MEEEAQPWAVPVGKAAKGKEPPADEEFVNEEEETDEPLDDKHPILVTVLVVAGRRLKGITSCYVRLLCREADAPLFGHLGPKKVWFDSRTQICGLGSSPVFNDAPFKFRFKRVTGMSLVLTVVATDGPERALFEWELLMSPREGVKGWVDVRNLTGAPIEPPPPQLNLQVTFRHISEPLHLQLLRPHLSAPHLEEIRAQTGHRSVLSPSDALREDWLRRLPARRSECLPALRLLVMVLLMVAAYVVPGFMLFVYKP